jgi:hypothetical protein
MMDYIKQINNIIYFLGISNNYETYFLSEVLFAFD